MLEVVFQWARNLWVFVIFYFKQSKFGEVFLLNSRRKNSASSANNVDANQPVTRADLEALKREILLEFRKEMKALKNDILTGKLALFLLPFDSSSFLFLSHWVGAINYLVYWSSVL